MESYLTQLFQREYDEILERSPAYLALARRTLPLYQQVQTALGVDFVDQLAGMEGDGAALVGRLCFARGFRLGAGLMLEAVRAPGQEG